MRSPAPLRRAVMFSLLFLWSLAGSVLLPACSSASVVPAWQAQARVALDRANAAYLEGDSRVARAEMARVRHAISATGRADLLAQAELVHCAARTASLVLEPCAGFESLRTDATAAQRAYADYLAGKLKSDTPPQYLSLLPAAAQAVIRHASGDAAVLQSLSDPLSRLLGVSVWVQQGSASPAAIALAVETASAQGWRRPLLAWLGAQALRARQAGDTSELDRVNRRITLVEAQGRP